MDSSAGRPSPRQRMRRWTPALICAAAPAGIVLPAVLIAAVPPVVE
jgi:hypothetical protein